VRILAEAQTNLAELSHILSQVIHKQKTLRYLTRATITLFHNFQSHHLQTIHSHAIQSERLHGKRNYTQNSSLALRVLLFVYYMGIIRCEFQHHKFKPNPNHLLTMHIG